MATEDLPGLLTRLADVPPPRIPRATYRLQFNADFGFRDAARLVPYLRSLGISDLYASPYLRARSGSTHGYDVADPNQLNPELGRQEDYDALVAALDDCGMEQLADVVPNHMGIGDPGNYRWSDVLENGPASIYARFFDINWAPLKAGQQDRNKVTLPVLGDQYGSVLERGELSLTYAGGAFEVRYYDHRFPVAPDTYVQILDACLESLQERFGKRPDDLQELASILTAIRHLPPREQLSAERQEERNREKEIAKRRLRALHATSARFRRAIVDRLRTLNGVAGEPSSFDELDEVLDAQSYRLAFWRVAAEEINYRRFFDINELAAVRIEDPAVFRATHALLLDLVGQGKLQGLRIDHPDGLRDPAGYFWELQRACFVERFAPLIAEGKAEEGEDRGQAAVLFDAERVRNPRSPLLRALFVVAEKILEPSEPLREDWPVHGTTGYDFLNQLNGLFVARENERAITRIYTRFVGSPVRYRDLVNSTKKMVMLVALASEVNELGYHLKRIAGEDRRHQDFTLNSLTFVIREVIAALPVYRTYVDPETGAMTDADRAYVEEAVAEAKRRNPRTDPSLFDFVRDTLLLADGAAPGLQADRLRFVARFQQATGPVAAKGVEDTAFYVYNRLVSLNEVGGAPDHFGTTLAAFHRANSARQRDWPATLVSTSTHDTKRSEDVRARISVLSELPRDWRAALTRWSRLNGRHRSSVDGRLAPDRNEEYLFYQSLLGIWPLQPPDDAELSTLRDRLSAFMLKAMREAKVNTSWINPNAAYESAVEVFVRAALDPRESAPFLEDFAPLCARISQLGLFNALSQVLLKLTSPGVPDVYQGNEIWDFSLVDPDNRRPVDYASRRKALNTIQRAVAKRPQELGTLARDLMERKEDGRIKLYVTHRTLTLRAEIPDLFARGGYWPLRGAAGTLAARHVCAFARALGEQSVVVVAPVLNATLMRGEPLPPTGPVWGDAKIPMPGEPGTRYRDRFTGREVCVTPGRDGRGETRLADLLAELPVALLVRT